MGARGEEDVEDLVVRELERFIGHVDLEGGDAFAGAEDREFGECSGAGVSDEEVEGIVAVAVAGGFGVRGTEGVEEGGLGLALRGEGDDCCRATGYC